MSKNNGKGNNYTMNIDYFDITDPKKWSLIGFLKKRIQYLDFLDKKFEYGTFTYLLKTIANGNRHNSKEAQKLLNNLEREKNSSQVRQFWTKQYKEKLEHKTKLQDLQRKRKIWRIESSDWDYMYDRDQELSMHVGMIRKKRRQFLAHNDQAHSMEVGDKESDDGRSSKLSVQQTEEHSGEEWEEESQEEYTDEEISDLDDGNLEQEEIKKGREKKDVNESNGNKDVKELLQQFSITYKNLEEGRKWTLKSGRKVEDLIYEYGLTLNHEDVLHSFVLNTDDEKVRDLFFASEWQEILETNVENKEAPVIDSDLLRHIARYRKTNARDLREVVNTPWYKKEDIYDAEKGFDYTWVHNCISNLLTLYEIKPQAFQIKHLERWYDTNIWSSVIDQCMWNLKDVELVRGESFSIASSARKSKGRTLGDRKPVGHRADGVLRKGLQEYGASEHGRIFQGEDDTKFLSDGRKLVKLLRDMMKNISNRNAVLKKIETVGYLHSERTLQVFVLDYLGGYMVRLRKGPIYEIPENLENIDNLLKLITTVLSSKSRIVRATRLLQIPKQLDEENFFEELSATSQLDRYQSNNKNDVQLPATFSTPEKYRVNFFRFKSPPPNFSRH